MVNRNYARLWYGQAASLLGDAVFNTTLALWVGTILMRTNRYAPAAVAGVLIAAAVAIILVAPLAGVFVDRWDKRLVMMYADLVRVGLVGALTLVAFVPAGVLPVPVVLGLIYLTVLLVAGAGRFFNPARFAIVGDVVPAEADRARASGIDQATYAIASIVGPPLAVPLLFIVGVPCALAVNAVSFLVSFFAVRSVRVPAVVEGAGPAPGPGAARPGVWREFAAGLRLLAGNRVLRAIAVTAVLATVGVGALDALDVFFVTQNMHATPESYGMLGMAFGIGLVVGAFAGGYFGARLGNVRVLCGGLLLAGVGLLAYARVTSLWQGLVVLALLGIPVAGLNVTIMPILLAATPREYLGRVISVIQPLQQLAMMVSVLTAGCLVSTVLRDLHTTVAGIRFGPIDTVFTAGGLLVVLSAGYATFALRGARRAPAEPVRRDGRRQPRPRRWPAPVAASGARRPGLPGRESPRPGATPGVEKLAA